MEGTNLVQCTETWNRVRRDLALYMHWLQDFLKEINLHLIWGTVIHKISRKIQIGVTWVCSLVTDLSNLTWIECNIDENMQVLHQCHHILDYCIIHQFSNHSMELL